MTKRTGRTGGRRPPAKARATAPLRVPVPPRTLWRILTGVAGALVAAALVTGLVVARIPSKIAFQMATFASRAGFTVRQVNIDGLENQPRLDIYEALLEGGSDALMLVNIDRARDRLVALPWVADASIHRSWPDTLDVRITEHRPAAIWQHGGELTLVNPAGHPLPSDALGSYRQLPLVVGQDAAPAFPGLKALLDRHPDIARMLKAAVRVGDRRWDLVMTGGETISLPEDAEAATALDRFARLEREQKLLGNGFERFDLRIPGKMAVRVDADAQARAKRAMSAERTARPEREGTTV